MNIGIVVQARFSSRRLRGKVLRSMAGKPILAWLIERLRMVKGANLIVIATSTDESDNGIVSFSNDFGIECFRGNLNDVLDRFVGVTQAYDFDAVVRISGDSPLLDPELVDKGIARFLADNLDLVTNVWPRTYPKGQSVEVISRGSLEKSNKTATFEDREHVTANIYRHHEDYRIGSFSAKVLNPSVQMSVDTEQDFKFIEQLFLEMQRPHWEYGVDELLALRQSMINSRYT